VASTVRMRGRPITRWETVVVTAEPPGRRSS
jgi:hypothetical protein